MHRRLWWGLVVGLLFWGAWLGWQAAFAAEPAAPAANPGVDCQPVSFTDDPPDPVAETQVFLLKVEMKNNSAIAGDNVTDATLRITLPEHFTYTGNYTATKGTCTFVGSNPGDGGNDDYLECTGIDLGPLESVFVDMEIRAPEGYLGTYTSYATAICAGDVNNANDTESNQITVRRGADIVLTKTVSPSSVADSGFVVYTIQVRNDGPSPAPDLEFKDTLPNGVDFVADDADPPADDDALWTCSAVGQEVTCTYDEYTGGDIEVGQSMTFHFRARANSGYDGDFVNNAVMNILSPPFDKTLDPDPDNNSSQATLTITPGTDLYITKSVSPDPVLGGMTATYTLDAENLGPRAASNVTVQDTMPAGYTIDNITAPAGWTCTATDSGGANPTVTCTKSTMSVGETAQFIIEVTPPNTTTVETHTNTATITPDSPPDPVTDNNTASVSYTISPSAPDLVLKKTKEPDPVAIGGQITNTIEVRNDGPVTAQAPIKVIDRLSGSESFDSAPTGSPWDCTYNAANHWVECILVDSSNNPIPLPAGQSAPPLEIHTIAQSDGPITNTATVTDGADEDFNTDNNTDQDTVNSTNESADLQVTKLVDDTHLDASEDTLTFTIRLYNAGPNASTDISFDDDVPFYMPASGGRPETAITVTSAPAGSTCTVSSGTIHCEGIDLAVGETAEVVYTVSRPMRDGTFVNDVCAYSGAVGDLRRRNNCDEADPVTVDPIADVEVTQKTARFYDDGSGKVLAGTTVTYIIQVRNNGPSTAANVVLNDVFSGEPSPPDFTFLSASVSSGGSCSYDPGTFTVTCSLGDMPVDSVKTVTVEIRPTHLVPEPDPWYIENTATAYTDTDERITDNNSKSMQVDIKGGVVDVTIEKNESPDFTEPIGYDPDAPGGTGNFIVYEVVVTNFGPSYATNVTVTDRVDWVAPKDGTESLEFKWDTANSDGTDDAEDWCTAPSPNPFAVNGDDDNAEPVVTCRFPDLAPDASAKRYLVFEVKEAPHPIQGDVYKNEAHVEVAERETDMTNNDEDERTTVRVYSDIAVEKTGPATEVEIYEPFTMTITVTNYGPGIAPNAFLSDTLPSGMELTDTPTAISDWGDPVSCSGDAGDTSFTCTLGHVDYDSTHTPARETITITVPVRVTDPNTTSYTNVVTVSSDAPEKNPDPHDNDDKYTVRMNEPVKLGDIVWYDQNQDGIQDPDEPGLNGVIVTLYDTPDCSGSPYDPGVSGFANPVITGDGSWPDGYYEFYPLPHGTYCLKFEVPSTVLDEPILSPRDQGSDDTADSDATEVSTGVYTITNIDLTDPALTEDMTNDVGVYEVGSIGDRVWCESPQNVNDTYDPTDGDTGTNNITVNLYADFDCDGTADSSTPLQTTTTTTGGTPTDPGYYQFTGLQVALAGSSNQTCYVVEVDTNDPDLGSCFLPDTPDDGNWTAREKPSLNLDTDNPDADDVDFSFRKGDFGDLPESGSGAFPTTLANNGPYHLLDEDLYLGDCADAETNGTADDPDAGMIAGGDDGTVSLDRVGTCGPGGDDEDGVQFVTPLIPGQLACIVVKVHNSTGSGARLYAWADWNGDGQFSSSEQLNGGNFAQYSPVPDGGWTGRRICFEVPSDANFANGDIHFRFRLTTERLDPDGFDGPVSDGEVEDYWLPLACVGNTLWDDGVPPVNGLQDGTEPGLAGIPVRLVYAGDDDTIDTAASDTAAQNDDAIVATTTTDANGRYMFCGIAPPSQSSEEYVFQVQVPPYVGLKSVPKDAGGDDALDSDAAPENSLGTGWVDDAFTVAPAFTAGGGPAYLTINSAPPPTGESGLGDGDSEANDNGYPDERTDWTHDFGFILYKDYGDLPNSGAGSFNTTRADGGPWHWVTPDLYLGSCVDVETDGQPDDADAGVFGGGDDGHAGFDTIGTCATPGDDEDGVELVTPLIPGTEACINVSAHNATGRDAYLYAWFDWNGDGIFDSDEQIDTGDFSGGAYSFIGDLTDEELCFTVPDDATFEGGEIHMRFRLTTDDTLSSPDGGAVDGEVEDYWTPIVCVGSLVWEDRDLGGDQDADEAPFVGMPVRLVYAGDDNTVDTEPNDTSPAAGERLYLTATDSDGLYAFCGLVPSTTGMTYQVQIANDDTGLYATDADAAGVPDDQDSDAMPEFTVDHGWVAPAFTLTLDDAQPGGVAKDGTAMPTGEAGLGDSTIDAADNNTPDARDDWTQDFGFVLYHDYGDLPESGNGSFATTLGNNGPYHRVTPDLMLGDCVDTETDGQPGERAGAGGSPGDDSSVGFATEGTCAVAGNDEDGLLSSFTPAAPGQQACFQVKVTNTTGMDARLYVWIDWDGDGQFQSDEQLMGEDFGTDGYAVIEDGLTAAVKTLCFTMPDVPVLGFEGGEVHARLRLTTEDLSARPGGYELWEGPAVDGEVEDYWAPLACVGNYVWLDTGTVANEQDADDAPLPGAEVRLVWAGPDGVIDTSPSDASAQNDDVIFATTTTDASGRYMFCGLPAGAGTAYIYQVQVLPMLGYYSLDKDAATTDFVDSDAAPENSLASGWAADTFGLQVDYTAAPGYILKDGSTLPTDENGNEDANSEASDNNFPDERTDWSQDFGFVKYDDYGDLPASFEGTDPASHPLRSDLYLGACVDAETTNAADAEAGMDVSGGDDNTAGDYTVGSCTTPGDDEDGIDLITPLVPGSEACVTVTAHNATGETAYLYAWFDWNGNGVFDSGEQIDTGDFSGGVYTFTGDLVAQELCFTVPSDATFDGGEIHYRFRLTTQADLAGPTGPATDGEVEDYWTRLACVGNLVWDDSTGASQDVQDAGDSPVPGLTVRLVWAGADNTVDTQASDATAQNDDRVYTTTTDSNGVYGFCGLTEGTYQIQIPNPPSSLPQAVAADQGDSDYLDSDGSQATNGGPVTGPTFTLTDLTALPTGENGLHDTGSAGYANNYPDNQVDESFDFGFRPVPVDFGDLPDTYSTSGSSAASHTISPNLYLGSCVDAETDGQPSTNADGDDFTAGYFTTGMCATAGDDEDGVQLSTPLVPGTEACIQVTAHNATGGDAYLYAWFDWNNDGDFDDAGEMVNTGDFSSGYAVVPDGGVTGQTYCFTVPDDATFEGGEVHMRFRLTTDTLTSYAGGAGDGEVEDYVEPLYCVGNFVWNDGGSATVAVQDGTEPGIAGVTVTLHWDGNDDGDFEDSVDRTYTTTTDANGVYTFCGLRADATNDGNADAYRVDVTPPAGLTPVAQDQGGNEALDSDGDTRGQGPIFTLPPSPDVDTAANDIDPNAYPDARTHLAIDFGFAAYDFGDLPSPYATTLTDGGPQHTILPTDNPTLGTLVDAEVDGQPDAAAQGDDSNGADDEDGVTLPSTFIAGHTYTIDCTVTNASSTTVVSAWIDWNGDGDFDDPGEQVLNNESASASCPSVTVTVPLDVAPRVGVRYRVANEPIPGPNGAVGSGEVEDYLVLGQVTYDYGDLPDSFATTEASGGPKHQLDANLYLGACVDSDSDGQPDPQAGTTAAGGDDAADATDTADVEVGTCTAGDDEDGVTLTTPLLPGARACITVTAHNAKGRDAYLYAWIDWDGSGSFTAEELINTGDFSSGYAVVPDGGVTDQTYCFDVPDTATFEGGQVYLRFRLTTNALDATDWGGTADDGEVEDYWEPLACVGNFVWDDTGSSVVNAQDDDDTPIEGLNLYLVWAGPNGTFDTDPGSTTAAGDDVMVRTTTDAEGRYTFCGLIGSSAPYRIQVPSLPAGLNQVVTPDAAADTLDSDAQQPAGPTTPAVSPDITLNRDDLVNNALPTAEDGQQDAATQADPTLTYGYPDGRTDLTVDFGFRKVNGAATKIMVATDQDFTSGTEVAIGEILTYEASFTLSPGTVLNLTLTDVLDRGLAFVDCESITVTGTVTASAGTWDDICANPIVQAEPITSTDPADQGRRVTWNFGTVTNSGTDDAVITVRYRAVVLDIADNTDGHTLTNHATWRWDAGSADAVADPPVEVVEPALLLSKEAEPAIAGPNEPITFTLTATHAPESRANAYDVKLHDELPEGLVYVEDSLQLVSGPTPSSMTYDPTTRTIEVVWDELPLGTTAVVEFQATLNVGDGVVVNNEAWLGWTSLPCDNCYPGDPGYTPSSPYNEASHERAYDPPDSGYVRKAGVEVYWVLPETGFAPGQVTELPAMPKGFQYADLGELWIEIPRLGVKVPVVGVPRTPNGWDLTWLGNKAGLLEGIGFPGWVGNAVITAHVVTADGLPGPFAGLDRLQWGDRILVHYQGVVYEFEVRERYYTNPYSTQVLEVPQEGYPWLTLVTCATYDAEQNTYVHRIVVQAVLIGRYSE